MEAIDVLFFKFNRFILTNNLSKYIYSNAQYLVLKRLSHNYKSYLINPVN